LAGLTPHIEENLTDEILRDGLVSHEPQREAKHPYMVPSVKHLHGEPVTLGDATDQNLVRCRVGCTQWPSRKVGRTRLERGSIKSVKIFAIFSKLLVGEAQNAPES
ncbi:MAG TPA: hypothetical protein VF523_17285, partial [Burkholderiales bacterium]